MHHALIFQGALVCSIVFTILGLRGRQTRRERDERKLEESKLFVAMAVGDGQVKIQAQA